MKSFTASYFKTHFGSVLDRAGVEPVRVERRGRDATILIPESEYRAMRNRMRSTETDPDSAMERLRDLAFGPETSLESLETDPRSAAILRKHVRAG